jgi:hypothetical protein
MGISFKRLIKNIIKENLKDRRPRFPMDERMESPVETILKWKRIIEASKTPDKGKRRKE